MKDEEKNKSQLINELQEMRKQVAALTRPMEDVENIVFEDLFNLADIQHLQDLYAKAFGVAALITRPDGTPITRPSEFTALCSQFIRSTPKGSKNCHNSDAIVGSHNPFGPTIQQCLSAGLCNAGASITVGGCHVANWLIGQVRNENQKEEDIMTYARELGANESAFRAAYRKVPVMPQEQFERVAQVLYTVASQLSMSAYQNIQKTNFITQLRQAKQALRENEQLLANILDSMPSVIVGVDGKGIVTQWNHRAEQATGMSFKKAHSKPLAKVFPQLSHEMNRIQTSIRDHRVLRESKVPREHRGETRYEDVTIYPLVANGVEGAVIRVDDVTDRVHMEEMMIQNEKILSVGGLAAGMAHEINNPLGGMVQTTLVMSQRLTAGTNLAANQQAAQEAGTSIEAIEQFMQSRGILRMLNTITESGQRVAQIVSNILSFARKTETAVSAHYLNKILDKTIELAATDYDLKKEYDFKQIKIIKEYNDKLPAVPCQASKIQQVVLNILTNGAQAMQEVRTPEPRFILRTYGDPDRNMACFEIEDNGPGMDEKTRKHIFDPFFTTKPVGVGTGLGLSVSYFIITETHKGEMVVESSPGAGSKFIIRLAFG
nr:PocR ligand-binding domain-containing protein [uncultured Desulfobacter sp.]